jgi:peptide-methionine (S)-S-oxide reductase
LLDAENNGMIIEAPLRFSLLRGGLDSLVDTNSITSRGTGMLKSHSLIIVHYLALALALTTFGCGANTEVTAGDNGPDTESAAVAGLATSVTSTAQTPSTKENQPMPQLETATFGAGCFWCVEAVLLRISGVESVTSGYMGGAMPNPTYEAVCTGQTGHAEVVQVKFNPEQLPFDQLLDVFWQLHDPTTLNRQGADIGTQYRSAIFYHTERQRRAAEASKQKWNESGQLHGAIVTEITAASDFYSAEGYHQDFFNKNPSNAYCRINILPKFKKLGLLKESDR